MREVVEDPTDTDHYLVSIQKMERVKPKKWDVQTPQENKEMRIQRRRKCGGKQGEDRKIL
jgi:hypothetical protein